jgi:hypothetical protein
MELPQNVVPMPAEKREELRVKAAAAQQSWASNIVGWHPETNLWEFHDLDNEDAEYIALLRPDTVLATLAYVEHLEAALSTTTEQLAAARRELAEQEVAALQWAKTLAEYNNELSRLRATNERQEYELDIWARYSNRDTRNNVEEAMENEPFAPKPLAPVLQEGEAGPALTSESANNLARLDYWRYVAGAEKPQADERGWAFPDNPTNPTGWNVYTGPELQYIGKQSLLCVGNIEEGECNFSQDDLIEDPVWFSPLAFDSAADYDASIKSVAARIASGEVKPNEQTEGAGEAWQKVPHSLPPLYKRVKVRNSAGKEAFASYVDGSWEFNIGHPGLVVSEWRELAGIAPLQQKGGVEGE